MSLLQNHAAQASFQVEAFGQTFVLDVELNQWVSTSRMSCSCFKFGNVLEKWSVCVTKICEVWLMSIRCICKGFYVAADGLHDHNGCWFMLKEWERPDHSIDHGICRCLFLTLSGFPIIHVALILISITICTGPCSHLTGPVEDVLAFCDCFGFDVVMP